MDRQRTFRRLTPLVASAALLFLSGCYSLGYVPVAGIEEIAVPIFRNDTLRRELDYDLTRHVRREVLEATPLHLAREGSADVILRGALTDVSENVLVSGSAEEVLAAGVTVKVVFGVYRGDELLVGEDTDGDGRPNGDIRVKGYSEFDTTRGQSRESATDEALRDAAELVVFRLEARHDDRYEPNDELGEARPLSAGREVSLLQRNADCFRLRVEPHQALRATVYFSKGDLKLRALRGSGDAAGAPLDDAEFRDDGRIVTLLAGAVARELVLEVTGDDSGAEYQLQIEALSDDPSEPDSTPEQASPLPGGQLRWVLRRLLRDDDYVAVSVPVGHRLAATLNVESEGDDPTPTIELRATDALGALLDNAELAEDGRSLKLAAGKESQRVLLRVSGDGKGLRYTLEISIASE